MGQWSKRTPRDLRRCKRQMSLGREASRGSSLVRPCLTCASNVCHRICSLCVDRHHRMHVTPSVANRVARLFVLQVNMHIIRGRSSRSAGSSFCHFTIITRSVSQILFIGTALSIIHDRTEPTGWSTKFCYGCARQCVRLSPVDVANTSPAAQFLNTSIP